MLRTRERIGRQAVQHRIKVCSDLFRVPFSLHLCERMHIQLGRPLLPHLGMPHLSQGLISLSNSPSISKFAIGTEGRDPSMRDFDRFQSLEPQCEELVHGETWRESSLGTGFGCRGLVSSRGFSRLCPKPLHLDGPCTGWQAHTAQISEITEALQGAPPGSPRRDKCRLPPLRPLPSARVSLRINLETRT